AGSDKVKRGVFGVYSAAIDEAGRVLDRGGSAARRAINDVDGTAALVADDTAGDGGTVERQRAAPIDLDGAIGRDMIDDAAVGDGFVNEYCRAFHLECTGIDKRRRVDRE